MKKKKHPNPKLRTSRSTKECSSVFKCQGFRPGESYASDHHQKAGGTGFSSYLQILAFSKSILIQPQEKRKAYIS